MAIKHEQPFLPVKRQGAKALNIVEPAARAPDQRTQTGFDLAQLERFAEIVVGTRVEAFNSLIGSIAGSQHQHRRVVPPGARSAHEVQAIALPCPNLSGYRQIQIEQNRVERLQFPKRGGISLVVARIDMMARSGEASRQHLTQHLIIFDQQDSHGYCRKRRAACWSGSSQPRCAITWPVSIRQPAARATRTRILRIARTTLCGAIAFAASVALAQPVTLEALLDRAIWHPDVASAQTEVDAALGGRVAADRAPLPVISTSVASIDLQNGLGAGTLAGAKRIDTGVGVDWTWERGDKRTHRTRGAEFSSEASRLDQSDVLIRRKIAIANAFWELLAAQEREADSAQMLSSAEQMVTMARKRLDRGDISEQEFARVAIETERARGEDASLRTARRLAAVALAHTAAIASDPLVAAPGWPTLPALNPHSSTTSHSQSLQHRPDVRAARTRVDAARSAVDLARSLQTTDVTLGGGFNHAPPDHRASIQLRAQFPWQINYRFEGEIRQAIAALERAELELQRTIIGAETELSALHLRRLSSVQRVQAIEREIEPRSLEVLNRAEAAYLRGAMPLTDLLDARRTFRAVRLDAVQMRAEAARADTEWRLRTPPVAP